MTAARSGGRGGAWTVEATNLSDDQQQGGQNVRHPAGAVNVEQLIGEVLGEEDMRHDEKVEELRGVHAAHVLDGFTEYTKILQN